MMLTLKKFLRSSVSPRTTTTSLQRRLFSSSSSNNFNLHSRLYRILQRQVSELGQNLEQNLNNDSNNHIKDHHDHSNSCDEWLLLHPPLNPHRMGHSKIVRSAQTKSDPRAVLRLFLHWEQQHHQQRIRLHQEERDAARDEREDDVGLGIRGRHDGHDDYEVNDNDDKLENELQQETERLYELQKWVERLAPRKEVTEALGLDPIHDHHPPYDTLWTTPACVRQAIQLAFRSSPQDEAKNTAPAKNNNNQIQQLHVYWALRAHQHLQQQWNLSQLTASMVTGVVADPHILVRVTAVSRCVGKSWSAAASSLSSRRQNGNNGNNNNDTNNNPLEPQYRFVYRIRIENVSDHVIRNDNNENSVVVGNGNSRGVSDDERQVVQLLGRSWTISEHEGDHSVLSNNIANNSNDYCNDNSDKQEQQEQRHTPTMQVDAPQTGAVGKHAVLRPGDAMEYMSGCDLATPTGRMQGHFYFATVPAETETVSVGQYVAALDPKNYEEDDNNEEEEDGDSANTTFRTNGDEEAATNGARDNSSYRPTRKDDDYITSTPAAASSMNGRDDEEEKKNAMFYRRFRVAVAPFPLRHHDAVGPSNDMSQQE